MVNEQLDWLSQHPHFTARFAYYIGELCREMSLKAVAELERLHPETVKSLDKLYLQEQLLLAGPLFPRRIGVDELALRKGQGHYRVVVSDLEQRRPIWIGGRGRGEADFDQFFLEIGPFRCARLELVATDMWPPFRNCVQRWAPQARVVYDRYHVMAQLSRALDEVRRSEYRHLHGPERTYIKGQRYALLSRREHLSGDGRRQLQRLLERNQHLHTAYLLKETFDQLWLYRRASAARAFFEGWRQSLEGQRLRPFEKFAHLVDRHWDGIAAAFTPHGREGWGVLEGINSKIRVLQRRAYGYRDEPYFRLKVIGSFLPRLPRHP